MCVCVCGGGGYIKHIEEQALHTRKRLVAARRRRLRLSAVGDIRRVHLSRRHHHRALKQDLAAVGRKAVLHQVQKVARKDAPQLLELRRRRQQHQLFEQPRAPLAARNLELLAVGLAVDVGDEEAALGGVGEAVALEEVVGAAEVFGFFVGEEAVELRVVVGLLGCGFVSISQYCLLRHWSMIMGGGL